MSKVINNVDARPGSIYRLALENFVTYRELEIYPSTSLNLIIGPNEKGKSIFVCAVILGLCGKTSVIGIDEKIYKYIQRGKTQATIEIELYQQPGEPNVIIKRTFNFKSVSRWSIDNKPVREELVQEFIASLNIQVDNLCQMLTEDHVRNFSSMDPQQLLRNTLAAVGGQELVSQLDELISYRNQQQGCSNNVQTIAQNLQEELQLNDRLKVVIDAMKQRKEIEQEIEMCERKKLWIEYQDLREKVTEYTNDKEQSLQIVNNYKSEIETLKQKLEANKEVHSLKDRAKQLVNELNSIENALKDLEIHLQNIGIDPNRNRVIELAHARDKLDKLNTDRAALVEKVGDETKMEQELVKLQKSIAYSNSRIESLKNKKETYEMRIADYIDLIATFKNNLGELQGVRQKRLEVLRTHSEDTYKAVEWLRQNREPFTSPVYEPMMLEITLADQNNAKHLEAIVPKKDLLAFTFESSEDMAMFVQKMQTEYKLKVHAVHSEGRRPDLQQNILEDSTLPRSFGFYTYLVDTFTAPEPITAYLCRQYNIHKIPITSEPYVLLYQCCYDVLDIFLSGNYRYDTITVSRKGRQSCYVRTLPRPQLLVEHARTTEIKKLNEKLLRLQISLSDTRQSSCDTSKFLSRQEERLNEVTTKYNEINERMEKLRKVDAEISLQMQKVQDIENEPVLDPQQEKEKCRREQKELVEKQSLLQKELCNVTKIMFSVENMREEHLSRAAQVDLESQLSELEEQLSNAQVTLENIENTLAPAIENAKEKLNEAKKCCNDKLPSDADFPHAEEFQKLPGDLNALQDHCDELKTRRDGLENVDERIIREYEEREKRIAELRNVVSTSNDTDSLETRTKQLKEKWLPSLEKLLGDIDKKFGDMLAKMGCAGEVKLDKGGSDEDYDKYGVCILVRFRAGEQLQQLTRHAQSGGERALATALYLIALQTLSAVPFICVDEIDLGSGQKMFQLLVKIITEMENEQFFVLTTQQAKAAPLSKEESIRLLDLVRAYNMAENTQRKLKVDAWQALTSHFNSLSSRFPLTPKQMRQKWAKLRIAARMRNASLCAQNKDIFPDDLLDKVAGLIGADANTTDTSLGDETNESNRDHNDSSEEVCQNESPLPKQKTFFFNKILFDKSVPLKTKRKLIEEGGRKKKFTNSQSFDDEYSMAKRKKIELEIEEKEISVAKLKLELENAKLENLKLKRDLNMTV